MQENVKILITEDDLGHAILIKKNLKRAGISNEIIHFEDGEDVLNYLFRKGDGPHRESHAPYLLLLDIRMPGTDGIEVLSQLKQDKELSKIPVIMLTTTDDPKEVEKCHHLGCSNYITKPVEYDAFVNAIKQVGLFLSVVQVPHINGFYS